MSGREREREGIIINWRNLIQALVTYEEGAFENKMFIHYSVYLWLFSINKSVCALCKISKTIELSDTQIWSWVESKVDQQTFKEITTLVSGQVLGCFVVEK